jgi:hypothetical protein
MKRDMDLIRTILFAIEEDAHGDAPDAVPGYSEEQVGYHNWLIWKEGLAEGVDASHMGCRLPQALLLSLTPTGHDFLDAARDDARWARALDQVRAAGGAMTIAVVQSVLVEMARRALGLKP